MAWHHDHERFLIREEREKKPGLVVSTKPGLQHKHKIKHDKTTIQFPVNAIKKNASV